MDDEAIAKFCACIDELGDTVDRLVQQTEKSKGLHVGDSVIDKKYKFRSGRVISYDPSTGVVVVQQGAGAWAAHEDEVDIQDDT